MFADDDESEESATGALRYPVMPSLVALQQMRSRLHMAQLGRKLMKWTSVAAAAELRRISADLQAVYKTFAEDMKEAFILLARCRYFFPELNNIVVNDLQKEASVSVSSSMKTVSGVRLIQYRIVETDTPYDYLGLGTGGETIEEAKKAWVKLLKLQIQMVELRRSFMIVEDVHKTATKRLNVINKIVIPRTRASLKYIQLELEEIEREELHRIKKIQAFKKKRNEGKGEVKKHVLTTLDEEEVPKVLRPKPEPLSPAPPKIPTPPPTPLPQKKPTPSPTPPPPKIPTPLPTPSPPKIPTSLPTPPPPKIRTPPPTPPPPKISEPSIGKPSELIAVHEPTIESRKEIFRPICCKDGPCTVTRASSPISHLSLGDYTGVSKLDHLKEMLNTTISLGQDVAKSDTGSTKIDEVIKLCKEAKLRLDRFSHTKTDTKLVKDLEHLKLHIREVIDVTRGLRDVTFLSPSVENFVKTCEKVDEKLKVAIRNIEFAELNEDAKNHLLDLKDEINDVLKVIAAYRREGLLSQSVEDFANVCKETKSKIECYTKEVVPSVNEQKLEHLKSHVDTLETLTTDVKRDGVRSASIERFLASCKDFKEKLEEYKKRDRQHPVNQQVSRLISQIDEAVKSTQAAKREGFVSASVDRFMKSCENFKTHLETKSKESQKPIFKLKSDIEEVMELISNLRSQGLITESTANFLRTCEETKNRLNIDDICPAYPQSKSILSPKCGEFCTCQSDQAQELCDRCKEMYEPEKIKNVTIDLPPPCNTCRGIIQEVKNVPCSDCNAEYPSDLESLDCGVCSSRVPSAQMSVRPCSSCNSTCAPDAPQPAYLVKPVEPTEPEQYSCGICQGATQEDQKKDYREELGVFEKKIKTITKITRYKTETGDIREEKEVTTIKRVKHDPHEMDIDDEDLESDESFEVGMCITPTQNQMGFRNLANKSKSEQVMRVSSLNRPHFRQCVSFNPQVCCVRTPSQILLMDTTGQLSSTTSLCIFQTSFI